MIVEILRLLDIVLSILGNWRQPLASLVGQPLVTVGLLLGLYAGWHIRDEGSVAQGLRMAFVDTRANREAQAQRIVAALLQAEVQQYARAGRLIDQALTNLLQHSAGAARIRLGVIHNGVSGLTGVSLLRYDIINAVALPGRTPGALTVNDPLTVWSDFLPSLLAGNCQLQMAADVRNYALKARLEALGADSLLACPVIDLEGKLLGAMLTNWDLADKPPSGEQLQAVIETDQRVSGEIASAITLRGRPSETPGEQGGPGATEAKNQACRPPTMAALPPVPVSVTPALP